MRPGISIALTDADRERLDAIVRNRNSPQKHVWRARIVLLTAAGLGTNAIMRETGKSKTCVWRWQERYMVDGVDGLVRDKTRPPRIAPLDHGHRSGHSPDEHRPAARSDTLDRRHRRRRRLDQLRPAHLARPSAPAASVSVFQTLPRSGVRRQG